MNLIKILPGSHHHHHVQVRELGCSWEAVGLEPPVHDFYCPCCSYSDTKRSGASCCLSGLRPCQDGTSATQRDFPDGLSQSPLNQSSPLLVRSLPTTLPSGVPLPTQPQAATAQAGESSSMNQVLSPVSFSLFLTAALGREAEEETVLLGSHGWQVVAAGLGLRPLWTRPFLRPEKPSQEQDHHTPTLTYPGDLWTPGPGNSVSHAGHLWEAWEHTPTVFDPSITHHHHSELDSFLLPITGHKRGESAPRSTQASDVPGYRLTHRFPPPTS